MQRGEQAEGGPCYWNACGQGDEKTFLMVSQVTEWIGSDVAKKPSEGAVRKEPVIPCSWIKSQQMKDNEIQEKTEMCKCWKIICSESNPAFQTPWQNLNLLEFTAALVKDFICVSKHSLRIGAEMAQKIQFQDWW